MRFQAENIDTLRARLRAPLLGVIPRLPVASAAAAASHLNCSSLPDWPAAGAAELTHTFSPEAKEV
jgi:dethiobiotin synthetase